MLRLLLERAFISFPNIETRKTVESLESMTNSSLYVMRFHVLAADKVDRRIEELSYSFQHFCNGKQQPKDSLQVLDEIGSLTLRL